MKFPEMPSNNKEQVYKEESLIEDIKNNNPEIFMFISNNYDPNRTFLINKNNEIETDEGAYLNTSRTREFARIAVAIKENLPAVPENYVRLWRGNRKNEVGKNPSYTNSLNGIALPFLMWYKGPLSYIDVPKEVAEKSLCSGAVAEGSEFILPNDLLSNVKIVGVSDEEKDALLEKSVDLSEKEDNGDE